MLRLRGEAAKASVLETARCIGIVLFAVLSGFLLAKNTCLLALNSTYLPTDLGISAAFLVVAALLSWGSAGHIRAGLIAAFMGFSILPVMLLIGMLVGPELFGNAHGVDFDGELWRSQTDTEFNSSWPPRQCMVDDLIGGKYLDGLDRDEVLKLLGPNYGPIKYSIMVGDVQYYLGPFRGWIRIDHEWLIVSFDASGKVCRYWVQTD